MSTTVFVKLLGGGELLLTFLTRAEHNSFAIDSYRTWWYNLADDVLTAIISDSIDLYLFVSVTSTVTLKLM